MTGGGVVVPGAARWLCVVALAWAANAGAQEAPGLPEPPAGAPAETAPATPPAATEPTEAEVALALLSDLQRYASLGSDDLRRESAAMTQALTRQRSDANRVRMAVLHTLVRTPQDDQRALQLLEAVVKGTGAGGAVRQLAAVLQVQVGERLRVGREEKQKADAALQKLEELRAMERSLMRNRVRSGGGGGGGGGGSGGGN